MRGRDYERDIPSDYLANLNRYYDDWMSNYTQGKKLIIDSDQLDFVKNPSDFELIASRIVSALDQRDLFLESRMRVELPPLEMEDVLAKV